MIEFNKATYRSQVRRLRSLAEIALRRYDIKVLKIEFINHGENATFSVHARDGQRYLLRVLRGGYHTDRAVDSELKWLRHLCRKGFSVPNPVQAKDRKLLIFAKTPLIPDGRKCALFEWMHGRFISKTFTEHHMYEVGGLLARLQKNAPRGLARHRRYWTADGLVGKNPKFGSSENLAGIPNEIQSTIDRGRKIIHRKLRSFERRFPKRQGFIHADLHFGNLLLSQGRIAAIDFDDSGFGFYAYDLAVPLLSADHLLGKKRQKEFETMRASLIRGYSDNAPWDSHDEKLLPHLIAARRIAMLGWLNSRSDNPRLKSRLKKAARSVANFVQQKYP